MTTSNSVGSATTATSGGRETRGEVPSAHIAAEADCVLVDEAQFLTEAQVEALREWTRALGVPVICYGLRSDFRSRLFEGSRRLLELADSIEEIKTTCAWCRQRSTYRSPTCPEHSTRASCPTRSA